MPKQMTLDCDITFGSITIGARVITVPVTINLEDAKLNVINAVLRKAELEGTVLAHPKDGDKDQGYLGGLEPSPFAARIKTGKYGVDDDSYNVTLSFTKTEESFNAIGRMSHCKGRLSVKRIGDAQDDTPGQQTFGGNGQAEDED